jgi:hypothetical protein
MTATPIEAPKRTCVTESMDLFGNLTQVNTIAALTRPVAYRVEPAQPQAAMPPMH